MFTGIIEEVGRVREKNLTSRGGSIAVSCPTLWKELSVGESVAVNGVCLTVTRASGGAFTADVSPESAGRTTLPMLAVGTAVNLERALSLGSRLGGHLVQGHVDGVGRLHAVEEAGDSRLYFFEAPEEIAFYLVEKGSVAVDGISLTVSGLQGRRFAVAAIPHTVSVTNLGTLRVGDPVNLEVDIIAKYVYHYLKAVRAGMGVEGGGSLYDKLVEGGFV